MRTGSPELQNALERGQRTYDVQVRLGGRDVTSEVTSWSVSRGSDTGLPEQIAVPTGSSAAEAKVELAGSPDGTAAARYSPWAPRVSADVTRPGQSCVVEWGLAEQRMQSLRGRIRSVTASASSGQADVTALDGAELLRGRAWLPPVADPGVPGARGDTPPVIHTQWAVDHALRMAGVYTSPPPRPGAAFYASMNGSIEANLGMLVDRSTDARRLGYYPERSPWTAAPALAGSGTWSARYTPQARVLSQVTDLVVEWWIYRRNAGDNYSSGVGLLFADRLIEEEGRLGDNVTVQYNTENRQLRTQVGFEAHTWTVPETVSQVGRSKIVFHISLPVTGDGVRVRAWIYQPDGDLYATDTYIGVGVPWGFLDQVTIAAGGPMESVGVTPVTGSFDVVPAWTRGAVVDLIPESGVGRWTGDYRLRALPAASGTWWDLLKDIAGASMSYMGFDEDGLFRFTPADYIRPDDDIEADLEVTATRDIAELTVSAEMDTVANNVSVPITIYSASNNPQEKHQIEPIMWVGPGATETQELDLPGVPWNASTPMGFAGRTPPSGVTVISCVRFVTADGQRAPVVVSLTYDTGQPLVVAHNRGAAAAWAQMPTADGQVSSLRMAYHDVGTTPGAPGFARHIASADQYGDQELTVDGGDWSQHHAAAFQLSRQIALWTAWPIPTVGTLEILPDPRIRQGDIVRIVDETGVRMDTLCRVLGYTVEGAGSSVRMTLDVRAMETPDRPQDAGLTMEPVLDPRISEHFPG